VAAKSHAYTAWIETNSAQQAEHLALAQVTIGSGADWKFKDVIGDIEVLSITESKP
jgi:hypothetical protein